MIDRIDGIGGPRPSETPERSQNPAGRGENAAAEERGDRVEVSEAAQRVAALAEKAAALPEIRQERVERIRESLTDGTYRVSPQQLARDILEFEDDLLG